jgi:hypothetical protein
LTPGHWGLAKAASAAPVFVFRTHMHTRRSCPQHLPDAAQGGRKKRRRHAPATSQSHTKADRWRPRRCTAQSVDVVTAAAPAPGRPGSRQARRAGRGGRTAAASAAAAAAISRCESSSSTHYHQQTQRRYALTCTLPPYIRLCVAYFYLSYQALGSTPVP